MNKHWVLTSLLLLIVMVTLIGPDQAAQAQDAMSRVRFLHAIPGAPAVDIYLDSALAAPGLEYGEATPHLTAAAGDHLASVRLAGSDTALTEAPVSLAPDLAFTLTVQGTPDAVQTALYEDILDELNPGMARLTAINTLADSPALDVLTTAGGPLLQGVSFGVQYGTINIPTGAQDLVMVPAGGTVDGAVAMVGRVPMHSGVLYTLVALGTLEGDVEPSVAVLTTPLNGAEGSVQVRVAHGAPDVPAVDVYANDMLLIPALEPGQMSEHIALPAGAYTLGLRAAGTPATEAPVVTADVTLEAATPAVTVAALGELSDNSLTLQTFPDNVSGMTAENARIAVVNTVPGATVGVTLADEAGTVLASDLAASAQSEAIDTAAGEYMLNVSIQGPDDQPVDLVVPAQTYIGGMYYTVLVYGGGVTELPYDAKVAGTVIMVTPDSLPGAEAGVAVAAQPTEAAPAVEATEEAAPEPTAQPEVVEATPVPAEPTAQPEVTTPEGEVVQETPQVVEATAVPAEVTATLPSTGETELVPDQPATEGEVVQAPTEAAPTPQPLITQAPAPVGYVQLDTGANLHCREFPRPDARSLGLIPSGTTLNIIGRTGEPVVPETGNPTPEPTPVVETIEDMWVSVQWNTPDGGFLRCWVAVQYLRVEFNGRVLDTLEELMELPEEPFNRPGEAVNTTVAPPTPKFNAILATVNLDAGVSLQLRRYPKTDAEALDLVPAGAQMEVLGYVEAPSEGLVGQPVDPNWVRVRYLKENGGATVGWVSAQYVTIARQGRTVTLEELPSVDAAEAGFYESPGQQPVIPIEQQAVVGVVNLDAGANLNLRDRPAADAFVVRAVPSGTVLTINGRNGDGTWAQVTYESDAGTFEGWVAAQYLLITRGGQAYPIVDLPNLTTDPDIMSGETAAPTATVTPTATPG